MKICVIPDLHNRVQVARDILEREANNVDRVVFLGDYFDNYGETLKDISNMNEFIYENIVNDKYDFLVGNHDSHYLFNVEGFHCKNSWSHEKAVLIRADLGERLRFFKWVVIDNNWLFSHAGIREYTNSYVSVDYIDSKFNYHIMNLLEHNIKKSKLLGCRGSVWSKDYKKFPVYARKSKSQLYNQMHGHISLGQWDLIQHVGYISYQIDTFSKVYAIVDTNTNYVEIKKSGYDHKYNIKDIKWLHKINQLNLLTQSA